MTTQTDKTVATEIFRQLGGYKFITTTGSRNFIYTESSLSFKVGSMAQNGVTHITIELNSLDLYDMTFFRCGAKIGIKTIATHCDLYADMLCKIITKETGLYTRLF